MCAHLAPTRFLQVLGCFLDLLFLELVPCDLYFVGIGHLLSKRIEDAVFTRYLRLLDALRLVVARIRRENFVPAV